MSVGEVMQTSHASRVFMWTALFYFATLGTSFAQATAVENGANVFKKCRACHLVGEKAKHAVGPMLNNVVGREAGSAAGYNYSDNIRELGQAGLVWTTESLNRYLENPKSVVPKGKMAFPGIADPKNRVDVIEYLRSLSE
jgi:cytochrome c